MGQHRFSPMCDFMDKCPQIFSASWRWQGRQSMRFLKKTVPLCGRSAAPQWPAYVSTRRTVTFARETAPPADHVDRYARRHAHGSSLRSPRANGHGSGSRSHVGDERQSREICCPQTPRNYRKLACGEHRRQAPGAEVVPKKVHCGAEMRPMTCSGPTGWTRAKIISPLPGTFPVKAVMLT